MYYGINNVAQSVGDFYYGVKNVAHKVEKGYIGVNGVAVVFYESGIPMYAMLYNDGTMVFQNGKEVDPNKTLYTKN